jgi:hypothetical protein
LQNNRLVLFCGGLHRAGERACDRGCRSVHIIFHLEVG